MNGHLNNTRYADIVCDAAAVVRVGAARKSCRICVHLLPPRGTRAARAFALRRARTLLTSSIMFNGEREGKSAFEASIAFADRSCNPYNLLHKPLLHCLQSTT